MTPIRIAIVGLGKIARTEHVPAIAGNDGLHLAATIDPNCTGLERVPHFESVAALVDAGIKVQAVVVCTPPQFRFAVAAEALARGWHVLLEKPPGATVSEFRLLTQLAAERKRTLFAAWHSRFAPSVDAARTWLAGKEVKRARITWREDVRVWHPGQKWIWEPGGFGVFDPGINAISIVTAILPSPLRVRAAELFVPSNCASPIAARIEMSDGIDAEVLADFDWRQTGDPSWDIEVETDVGVLKLTNGGHAMEAPGAAPVVGCSEYPALYARFATLIADGESDADGAPLELVADCFLRGRFTAVERFD